MGLQLTDLRWIDRGGATQFSINPASVQEWKTDANPPVIACEEAALWQVVAAGDLEPELLEGMARQGHIVRRERAEDLLGRSQLTKSTLIHRTLAAFEESFARGGLWSSSAVVWLCGGDDFEDAFNFWNIRALAPIGWTSFPMLMLPDAAVEHWGGIAEQVQGLLARPDEFSPDVHVTSLSLPEARVHQLAEQLGLQRSNEPPSAATPGRRSCARPRSPTAWTSMHVSPLRSTGGTAGRRSSRRCWPVRRPAFGPSVRCASMDRASPTSGPAAQPWRDYRARLLWRRCWSRTPRGTGRSDRSRRPRSMTTGSTSRSQRFPRW